MATLIFAAGAELTVTADLQQILELVESAQRSGAENLPAGWIMLTASENMAGVAVQTARIAYIRP